MSYTYPIAAELQLVEEQLDILIELSTWFGHAGDITVQEFADEMCRQSREEALLEPLDFEDEMYQDCLSCSAPVQKPQVRCWNCIEAYLESL